MKNVKKLLALLLAMVMLFTLCACTITVEENKGDDKKENSSQSDDDKNDKEDDKNDKNDKNDKEDDKNDKEDDKNSSSSESDLVGSWESQGVIMTLKKNGSGELDYDGMTLDLEWEVDGNEITIVMSAEGESEEITMEWEIDDNKLIFIDEDGEEEIWYEEGTAPEEDEDDVDYEEDYEDEDDYDYDAKLVGDWESDGVEMSLYADGTGVVSVEGVEIDLDWVTLDGSFALLMEGDEYYGEYTVRNGKLTINYDDGTTEIWNEN